MISYNNLWKMLIDKGMNKQDLRLAAGVSTTSIQKLTKGESITTGTLLKICKVLDCKITDIMEQIDDSPIGIGAAKENRQ
jgi:DNA-binding Xre family transcriptional regulator